MNPAASAVEAPAITAHEIRGGMFRGIGMRHVALVVLFTISFDVLGQLGWIDSGLLPDGKRLRGLMQMPAHLAIGMAAILAAVAAENALAGGWIRKLRYPIAVLVASVVGTVILESWAARFGRRSSLESSALLFLGGAPFSLLAWNFLKAAYICILVAALHSVFEASRRAGAALHAARMAALDTEHEVVEGDLRAMQARVDPELLFDTLRDVDTAYARDPASGQCRLDALIRFLRAALPGETTAASTVSREWELALAYVALVAGRDGAHPQPEFEATFEVDSAALGEAMPSMLLLPLVRWALAGGSAERLRVCITQCDRHPGSVLGGSHVNGVGRFEARLEIAVENRVSSAPASHDGEVDSVRSRLWQLYADRALLQVWCADHQRRALLKLPLRPAGESSELFA